MREMTQNRGFSLTSNTPPSPFQDLVINLASAFLLLALCELARGFLRNSAGLFQLDDSMIFYVWRWC